MRDLATEIQMSLVTGRLESQSAKFLLSSLRSLKRRRCPGCGRILYLSTPALPVHHRREWSAKMKSEEEERIAKVKSEKEERIARGQKWRELAWGPNYMALCALVRDRDSCYQGPEHLRRLYSGARVLKRVVRKFQKDARKIFKRGTAADKYCKRVLSKLANAPLLPN